MNPRRLTELERSRIVRVDRLVATGEPGVPELVGMLTDPSWTVRRAVIAGLASLGDLAVGPLCAWLRDRRTDENAIAAAVDALVASLGPSTNGEVLRLTEHENPHVAADAAQILGRRRVGDAVTTLAKLVMHESDIVSVSAIEALGAIGGTAAVEALIRIVESRQFFRTFPAIQVLSRTGDPRSVPPLAALLADETYRIEVVRALGHTGLASAIPPITSLLHSPSDAIVRLVAVSLSELVARATWAGTEEQITAALRTALAPWLPRLASALHGADPMERTAIATLLGHVGDVSVLPAITAMLEDASTAAAATDALQHLGRAADTALVAALSTNDATRRAAILPLVHTTQAVPTVRALLRDEDPEVRARACEALARLGDTASVPSFFAALGDPSARVAHAAVSAILTLGTSETEALALAAVSSHHPGIRRHALRLLGTFGFPSAFEPLRKAIDDPDRRNAELAIAGLGAIDDPRVDEILVQVAGSSDEGLRSAAMRAAGHRGSATSLEILSHGITDASAWVRYYAAQGLGRVGDASHAPELLIQRLRDSAAQVRIAAIEALSRLGSPQAWEAVCRAAASHDPDERRAGLVGVGMHAREGATDLLIDAAKSEDPATRLVAVSGLARLDAPRALAAIEAAIADPSPEVRDAALSLLAERQDEAAAQVLVDLALGAEPDHPVQRALSRPAPSHIAAIVSRLASADDRTAPALAAALTRMHAEAATSALFDALALANPAARAAAATALVAADVEGARCAVSKLAQEDPDPEVRRVCSAAVGAP